MVLKSFEIQGFKSFPDKTLLNFNGGVTTVVGPNGSGKSNVAEAIRWVLGEQSAKSLRCDKKMEELIFHGAQNRGPVGFCEATIKLDNSNRLFMDEHDEVSVTRRLYRSGESEYYINKQSVRLKDVLDMFLGTGLGRDGYSIIGQGRIGEILSDKSTDRRRVFEEAAGISRYRARKDDAERKLEHAEDNLTRIQDKIDELNLQRDPLKEQAERAKAFLLLRDEQKLLEINVWLHTLDKARAETERARRDHSLLQAEMEAGHRALDERYEHIEELAQKHQQQQQTVEEIRADLSRNELEAQELESKTALIKTNIGHCEEHIERITGELDGQIDRRETLMQQAEERRKQLTEINDKLGAVAAELENAAEEINKRSAESGDLEAKLAACKLEEARALDAVTASRDALSTLEALSEEMSARRQVVMAELASRNKSEKESTDELEALDAKIKEARENMESLVNVIEGYKIRLGARTNKANDLREKFMEHDRRLHALESKATMLRDMEREYEGFPRAVKSVMHEKDKALSGIRGTVSELIRVDDSYTVAIETALGNALQNIVVNSEQDAKECIQYLKSRNIGRATFLPLSAVRGDRAEDKGWSKNDGFVGLACDLVRYDAELEGVIYQLLGRTLVARDMDAAIAIARSGGYRIRVVTQDGQIISAGGAMTGGATAQNVGLLSRQNELERLDKQIIECAEVRSNVEKELKTVERELSAAQYELGVAEEERRETEVTITTLSAERTHKQTWMEQITAAVKILKDEMNGISERLAGNERRTEELNTSIDADLKRATALHTEAQSMEQQRSELDEQGSGLTKRISDARAEQAALTERRQGIESSLSEYQIFISQLSGDNLQKEALMEEQKSRRAALQAELEGVKAQGVDIEERHEEIRKLLMAAVQTAMELEAERSKADKGTKDINEQNLRLEREAARLDGKRIAAEQEEKQILDRLWENYGLTHQDALKQRTELESVPAANRRIAELKRQITELGQVNIGAIDEFARVDERYTYLTLQSEDARKSKTELLGILEEIVTAMRGIFAEKFEKINEKFTETFLEIFGGGQGYLELENPEDLLGTGIDIKVQPPGKRLGSLAPLSGGERSLIAIALYFALFKVNPAPFCVLDEVDHDLDEVNVARYADYLVRMSKQLQFVVITHRRGTMEVADYLYGVTSEQQGVSKILPLDINEVERTLGLRLK